jgi:hypothetical protein
MATTACGSSATNNTPQMGPNPGPNDPNCTSCGYAGDPRVLADIASGGNCSKNNGYYDPAATPAQDSANTRGIYDKFRFGIDPTFPLQRYVNGLTSPKVPDRIGEHPMPGDYVGTNDCSNPIFSMNLPADPSADLCHLMPGPRSPTLVYFLTITGLPHQLLQQDPTNADSPQKDTLTTADWVKILGQDPTKYDFTCIAPPMFASIGPRPSLPPPSTGNGPDPIHGREWDTKGQDQQYACTFPLATPRDCTANLEACDCTAGATPPLCDPNTPTTQIRGKAYPSPRELQIVQGVGKQGIVSSLCPIHVADNMAGDDPLYGYRPAINTLINRLRGALPH